MDCVFRRGKVYCAIISVPIDLHNLVGKKQIWRSLKTKAYSVARSQARKLLLTADQLFSQIRNTMDSNLIKALVADFGLDLLKFNDEIRLGTCATPAHYTKDGIADLEYIKKFYADASRTEVGRTILEANAKLMSDRIQKQLFENTPEALHFVSGAFEIFLDKHGIALPPLGSSDAKEIMTALAQTAKLAYLIEKERVMGIRDESDFQYRTITKWQADLPLKKDVGLPLSELFAKYHDDWSKDHPLARSNRKNTELKRLDRSFTECFAKVPGVKELTEEMAKEWREYIQHEFYDVDLTNKTVNNYLETMSAVFNYGSKHKNKYTDGNPFKGIRLPEGVASERSRIFEHNELQEYVELLAGLHHHETPEMTWLPLIMMFSGMRCNEIAQLFVDDLQEKDGIYFFRITEDVARNQHVKSLTSKREVPIHNTLKELGLLDYVAKMKAEGHYQIFPNCQFRPGIGLYYDANMSFQLNIPINLIDKDKKLRLYSLRANFRNSIEEKFVNRLIAVMDSGVSSDIGAYSRYYDLALNNILGHAITGTVGDMVYRKRQLHIMDVVLQQAEYPLDISTLKIALNEPG